MECKVEKFQMSPYFTASTLPHNGTQEGTRKPDKPTTVLTKRSSQFTEVLQTELPKKNKSSKKLDDTNVALNLCPDVTSVLMGQLLMLLKHHLMLPLEISS